MLWLFGEMWLWLLIAFAIGALTSALALWPVRRRRDDAVTAEPAGTQPADTQLGRAADHPATAMFPPVAAESQTGMLPAMGTLPDEPEERTGDAQPEYGRHASTRSDRRATRSRAPRTPDVEHGHAATDDQVLGTLDESNGTGRTSGTLPSRRAWHARNEWPDEADEWATEHDIPRSGG